MADEQIQDGEQPLQTQPGAGAGQSAATARPTATQQSMGTPSASGREQATGAAPAPQTQESMEANSTPGAEHAAGMAPTPGAGHGPGLEQAPGLEQTSLGFMNFVQHADSIALAILVVLVLASVISWYLILTKTIRNGLSIRRSRRFLAFFWDAPSISAVAAYLEAHKCRDPFSRLAYQGVAARAHLDHHGHRMAEAESGADFLTRTLRQAIDAQTARAEFGLTTLAAVGSTAPFVGLLGTVWGIYHALISIAISGSSGLAQVAGPVGEALIMTAIGLAVAIPAVLGYNFLVRSNRVMLARLDGFAYDLFTFLTTGVKLDGQSQQNNVARMRANQTAPQPGSGHAEGAPPAAPPSDGPQDRRRQGNATLARRGG